VKIAPTTTSFALDNNAWLGSSHGTEAIESITVDADQGFVAGTHYPNGFIPSGTPLGKITASGKYGLYDDAASDGRQTLVGFLMGGLQVTATTDDLGGALFVHGKIRESKLPFTVDANGKADVASRIRFI
jgi:hypothetical protein